MKNKIGILYLILCLFFYSSNIHSADKFSYEANQIEVLDNGNIIKSRKGVKIFLNDNIDILSNNFQYNKKKGLVELSGDVKIIDRWYGWIEIFKKLMEIVYSIKSNWK